MRGEEPRASQVPKLSVQDWQCFPFRVLQLLATLEEPIRRCLGDPFFHALNIRKNQPAPYTVYCNNVEPEPDGNPWYHDVWIFLRDEKYPESTNLQIKEP